MSAACGCEVDGGGGLIMHEPWCPESFSPEQPAPTAEDYCASEGHVYHSDDSPVSGRCYCGQREYPAGGDITPVEAP